MIYTLDELAALTVETLNVFSDAKPDLVPTGFKALDAQIGGVDPGSANLLLADQHVGKTHSVLHAARNAPHTTGIISLEDGAVTLGSRQVAGRCQIDPLDLRKKNLSSMSRERLQKYLERDRSKGPKVAICVGASKPAVLEAIQELCEAGCRLIWIDYAQKHRGTRADRNNEVAGFFTDCHSECARNGAAMFMVSQVTGVEAGKFPGPWNARESRDLANEARLILGIRAPVDTPRVRDYRIWKSSFGSVHNPHFQLHFDDGGTLVETLPDSDVTFGF